MADDNTDPPANTGVPVDHLIALLSNAEATLPVSPFSDVSGSITANSDSLFTTIMATVQPNEPADPTNPGSADLSPFYHQRDLDRQKATSKRRSAMRGATTPLEDESDNWQVAVNQYNFAIAQANSTLSTAIEAAKTIYNTKYNQDSTSRAANLYYELKEAVAVAVQTYNASCTSAGAALATEVGTLVGAYATYVGATEGAQAQYQLDLATANQTFWQSVEGVLDAP